MSKVPSFLNKKVSVIVSLDRIKQVSTKNNKQMAFLSCSDNTDTISVTLFPETYSLYSDIKKGDILKIRGVCEKRYDEYQIIADNIIKLDHK